MGWHRGSNIYQKLQRAEVLISELERQIDAFADLAPYSLRFKKDLHNGVQCGRLIAVKNPSIGVPGLHLALMAGEVLYQLRSTLDHAIHDLIIRSGKATRITRRTQFPICDTADSYRARAGAMIEGVSRTNAALIEGHQPYRRSPHAPRLDPLWILQDLNNTDKHRLVPTAVIGLRTADVRDNEGPLFSVGSSDIVLKHNKVFFSFTDPKGRYDELSGELRVAVAFATAMRTVHGGTLPMHVMLMQMLTRVYDVVGALKVPSVRRRRNTR